MPQEHGDKGSVQRFTVTAAVDASGDFTGYTPYFSGRIIAVVYTKTDYAAGVDFDITLEGSSEVVWDEDNVNASKTVYPRAAVHSTAGVALTYDATQPVTDYIWAGLDRVEIVVSNGGVSKTGSFQVVVANA